MTNKRKYDRYDTSFFVRINGREYTGIDISKEGVSFEIDNNKTSLKPNSLISDAYIIREDDCEYKIKSIEVKFISNKEECFQVGGKILEIEEDFLADHQRLTGEYFEVKPKKSYKNVVLCAKEIFSYDNIDKDVLQTRQALRKILKHKNIAKNVIMNNKDFQKEVKLFLDNVLGKNKYDFKVEFNKLSNEAILNLITLKYIKNLYKSSITEELLLDFNKEVAKNSIQKSKDNGICPSICYLLSFSLNMGKIFLYRRFEKEGYDKIISEHIINPDETYKKEIEEFETTHIYASASIMKKLFFSDDMIKVTLSFFLDSPLDNDILSKKQKIILKTLKESRSSINNKENKEDEVGLDFLLEAIEDAESLKT